MWVQFPLLGGTKQKAEESKRLQKDIKVNVQRRVNVQKESEARETSISLSRVTAHRFKQTFTQVCEGQHTYLSVASIEVGESKSGSLAVL